MLLKELYDLKKVSEVGNLVMSDPSYPKDVWCRYERDLAPMKNCEWECEMYIAEKQEHDDEFDLDYSCTDFDIVIRPRMSRQLVYLDGETHNARTVKSATIERFEVGCDTASFVFGFDNIMLEDIFTGADGYIADVYEIKLEETLIGIVVSGSLSQDIVNAEKLQREIIYGLGLK